MKIAKWKGRGEIFETLQGEGQNIGLPSVFIRSTLCNLHCFWCDTDYTWNWVGTEFAHQRDSEPHYQKYKPETAIIELTVEQIFTQIQAYPSRNVVITGGEPLLQQTDWIKLMHLLRRRDPGYQFEVETNGTIVPLPDFDRAINQYNVSPKLENSGNPQSLRENPQALAFFVRSPQAFFKFVLVDPMTDLLEILTLQEKYGIPSGRIFLMAAAATTPQLEAQQEAIVQACLQSGFRYSDRLHLRLFGNKRGT